MLAAGSIRINMRRMSAAVQRSTRVFLTIVDTGLVKKKRDNKGIKRGFDSIKA